ncbi:MAG: TIGR01777 family oxidoreductase [Gemmatimonadaceae bacterium]
MIIVMSGASGFIGSALSRALRQQGHEVRTLVRRTPRSNVEISWDIERGTIDAAALEGTDAVIHLAGESLVQRWSDDARRRIRESRVKGTALLANALSKLSRRPQTMLSGSAIGIYGNRGDELLDEDSRVGDDFLASVCIEWERATAPAIAAGVRVVELRTGLVLGKNGGMLSKLLLPFKLGVGGRVGSGKQWMSCIALEDYVELAKFALSTDTMSGPVNFVGPAPVTNEEFTKTLAKVLHRPTLFPVPAAALKLAMGEMAEDTLLASQRVIPGRALAAGFAFRCGTLDAALRSALAD